MKTSDEKIEHIYDELINRVQYIISGKEFSIKDLTYPTSRERYDLSKVDTPTVGEVEDAFLNWNCAILTAFRKVEGMGDEENHEWNRHRNDELKRRLIESGHAFRSVFGRYREAHWEEPDEEICFFVTNADVSGRDLLKRQKEFFKRIYYFAEDYDQDSFLYTFSGLNRVAFLVATNDNARKMFRGDIKFAGPLFTNVPDIGDWTQCSNGRISFRLNGMILMKVMNFPRIKIGEGNMFNDTEYDVDSLIVIREQNQTDLIDSCKNYTGSAPLVERFFRKKELSSSDVEKKIKLAFHELDQLTNYKCKRIGFHCTAAIQGNYLEGARVVFNTVRAWSESHKTKTIILVDIYGEFNRVLVKEIMGQ